MAGLHPPVSVIATWSPNYTDPEIGGRYVIIVASVLLAFVYVVVALRVWARFHLAKNSGIDDYLIVTNLVCILSSNYKIVAYTS
jgi:hypothetical protein